MMFNLPSRLPPADLRLMRGRLVGIAVAAFATLALAACGSSTTTVINEATATSANPTVTYAGGAQCGDFTTDGIYNLNVTGVDCDEGRKIVEQWRDQCLDASSSSCIAGSLTCIARQGDDAVALFCQDDSSEVRVVLTNVALSG